VYPTEVLGEADDGQQAAKQAWPVEGGVGAWMMSATDRSAALLAGVCRRMASGWLSPHSTRALCLARVRSPERSTPPCVQTR
jgi:hypothetical protein